MTAWIAEVQAERLAAEVELDRATGHRNGRLSRDQLAALISGLGNLLDVLATAAPEDKAEVYARLGVRLDYDPARRVVSVESRIDERTGRDQHRDRWGKVSVGEPSGSASPPRSVGKSKCRRGDLNPWCRGVALCFVV